MTDDRRRPAPYTRDDRAEWPTVSPLLVGRDDLLDLADRRLDEAAERPASSLLIAGEAGHREVPAGRGDLGQGTAHGFRVTQGRSRPAGPRRPGGAVPGPRPGRASSTPSSNLWPISSTSRDAAGAAGDADVGCSSSSRRALRRVLDQPTVLIFEDLQWADELTLEIVAELARTTRDRPLLLIGAYRPDEAPPGTSLRDWRSRLVTQRIAEEIRLVPLDLDQTAPGHDADPGYRAARAARGRADAVYERTDGIPLHIEELLGAMSAQARADGRAIREANVPETIEDAVLDAARPALTGGAGGRPGRGRHRPLLRPRRTRRDHGRPGTTLDEPMQELIDHGVLDRARSHAA